MANAGMAEATKEASAAISSGLDGRKLRIAVIGAGPAGFYATGKLLAMPGSQNLRVDMFEELPVPFGLVRYGVAPDHPEVKNCTHKFEDIAEDSRFSFHGNVQIGGSASDWDCQTHCAADTLHSQALNVPLSFLMPYYHAILLTYGASADRTLGPGVTNDDSPDLQNVLTARSFVHWYNGHPHSPLHSGAARLDLSNLHSATIIGQGNVALDSARMLLSGGRAQQTSRLAATDTPESVLACLAESGIKQVDIAGRRGPLQFSGTTKEMRELINLDKDQVKFVMSPEDKSQVQESLSQLADFQKAGGQMDNARMKKRLLDLMRTSTAPAPSLNEPHGKQWSLKFCQSPVGLYSKDRGSSGPVKQIDFEMNDLLPVSSTTLPSADLLDPGAAVARGTGQTATVDTDFVLKSVGYRSIGIRGVPYDGRRGVIRNENGRIADDEADPHNTRKYTSGWLARGPNGVIATTMYDAYQVAGTIAADLMSAELEDRPGLPTWTSTSLGNQPVVTWRDWKAIDAAERARGAKIGKEREKFVTVQEMLHVIG